MPSTDWSMSILGYERHTRSGSEVIAVTHLSTHDALVLANAIGLQSGWIWCDEMAAQIEDLPSDRPTWAPLTTLFTEQRVANTEGMVGGALTFVHAQENTEPSKDVKPQQWAAGGKRAWVEIIDNEMAYWGGLNDEQQRLLVTWFCSRRPLDGQWQSREITMETWQQIKPGLFRHGWSRNCDLVSDGRKLKQEWWAGIHAKSALHTDLTQPLSVFNQGVLLRVQGQLWIAEPLSDKCPLDDKYGRLYPPVTK